MASQGYYDWIAAGSPYVRANPSAQLRAVIQSHGYTVYDYPDQAHLLAATPEDHTPFSETGWPVASRRWVGHAIDVMPPSAVALDKGAVPLVMLARQVIADKDAGVPGTKCIKYINWTDEDGNCWQTSWKPTKKTVRSTDRGHIHISVRSDMDDSNDVIESGWDPVRRASVAFTKDDLNTFLKTAVYDLDGTGRGTGYGTDMSLGTTFLVLYNSSRDAADRLARIESKVDSIIAKLDDSAGGGGTAGGLTPEDHAAIRQDLKEALREGTGSGA